MIKFNIYFKYKLIYTKILNIHYQQFNKYLINYLSSYAQPPNT
jgi:hypothetical protein